MSQEVGAGVTVQPVVVDDASKPPASVSLGELADDVLIVRNEYPRGPASARNQGATAVAADFVAYLDDDDYWLPGKLRACIAAIDAFPDASMVFHQTSFKHVTPRPNSFEVVGDPIARFLHRQPPHINGVVVRSSTHRDTPFDESFPASAELDYLFRIALAGRVVELGSVYAVHGENGADPSAISVTARITGRRMLRQKHRAHFDRKAKAHSDLRIGHQYRRLGRRRAAAKAFLAALLWRPMWASPWKGLLGLALPPTITHRLVQRRASARPRSRL